MKDVDEVEVEICRAELEEAKAEFSRANTRMQKARVAMAAALSPFEVGDFAARPDGTAVRIEALVPTDSSQGPEVMLRVINPKGEISNLMREVYKDFTAGQPFQVEGESA